MADQQRPDVGPTNTIGISSSPFDDVIYPGVTSAAAIYARMGEAPPVNPDPFDARNAVVFTNPSAPQIDWRAVTGLALQQQRLQREAQDAAQQAAQRTWADTLVTSAARVGLPVVGGVAGALAGPVGALAGAATGGFIGEDLAQLYEMSRGQRAEGNPVQALTQGALAGIPGAQLRSGMGVLRQLPRVAGVSTGIGALSSGATQLAETGTIAPTRFVTETALGGVLGTGLGSAGVALQNPAVRQALASERGSIQVGPPPMRGTQPMVDGAAAAGTAAPAATEPGPWSRIAGEQLPPSARGVLDDVPVPASMTPAGLPPNAPAVTARIDRFVERHGAPAEVKDTLREILTEGHDYALQAHRRMGMTWEQLDAEASRILPRVDLPKGSIVSPEEVGALRVSAFGLLQRAVDLSADMQQVLALEASGAGSGPAAAQAREQLQALLATRGAASVGQLKLLEREAVQASRAAVQSLMGARSEYGRGLNYFKSLKQARVTDDADFLAAAIQRGELPDRAIDALRAMPNAEARFQYLMLLRKPNAQQVWHWYARTAYLSGVVTQWRNLSGNAVNFGVEAVLTTPAAAMDAVRNPGNRQVVLNEQTAAFAGTASGYLDGVRKGLYFFRNGFVQQQAHEIADLPPEVFGGALLPNVVGRTMGAVDQFFRTVGIHMELHRSATLQAVREGLSGEALTRRVTALVEDPTITPEMHKRATRYAAGLVYQDVQGPLAQKYVGAAHRGMQAVDSTTEWIANQAYEKGLKKLGLLGDVTYGMLSFPPSVVIAPFINTPFNILKRTVEYSPAGLLAATQGGSREAMMTAARGAVGTAVMAAGVGLFMQGRLTGAAPRDRAESDAFYASGKRPYAIRVGDQWVPYQYLGQFGILLGALANYAQATSEDTTDASAKVIQVFASVGRGMVDAMFLKGMYNVLDTLANADKGHVVERFAGATAAGLLPAAGAQRNVRDLIDPTLRDPKGTVEHLMAGTPGLSSRVEPRLDFSGQEVQRGNTVLPTPAQAPDFRQELVRLRAVTGEGYLRDPVLAAKGLQEKLNTRLKKMNQPQILVPREEHTRYAKAYGRLSAQFIGDFVNGPDYQTMSDDDRLKGINRIKDTITEELDAAFVSRFIARGRQTP